MIVDLNLRGKRVLVVGAGHEAERKVEALLSQGCEIVVVAQDLGERLEALWQGGKIKVKKVVVKSGGFLDYFDRLTVVMAVTDDREINRKIVEAARKRGIYTYAADDPAISDFSHPAVINLHDKVQIAISTGGMSPLMARTLREKAEKVFTEMIRKEDLLQIELQDRLRGEIKGLLQRPEERKEFLVRVLRSAEIRGLLSENRLDEAERCALGWLKNSA
ncbi:MAG: bifunctional precorrin-2 dehydrogenase/sirohydrochlorin ferrochelatase [Nitrospinaceae bacterium]|nr:MAG: bifunctional precorrin-2 dehydrogenase/sirohydrochlorin ferrochelatase [Nitrospinaceae bacterium]